MAVMWHVIHENYREKWNKFAIFRLLHRGGSHHHSWHESGIL